MTLTRKLALALCLAFSFITLSSNAQVDSTTDNLINFTGTPTATTSNWNNGVYVNQLGCFGGNTPGNCGPYPNVQTNGSINFSYGQVDLNQIVNINKALSAGGTGVQLSGFNFGFMAKNGNGWDDGRQDYLSAYVKFYNAGGGLAANYDYTSQTNQKYNWTQFNFSETFASPIAASNYSNAQVGFVGRDNNYWAGPYGPEINNVSFSLKYRVDPCATNPAYSSTCTGFNNVINSTNLFNSSQGGGSLNQAFAINTALGLAGSGATVHGINYGFNYTVGQGFFGCTAWNQDGSCSWTMNTPAYVSASMSLRNSDNQVIHQKNYSFAQEGTSGSVSEKYLLPSSMNQTLLGTARLTASTSGTGSSVSDAWANIIYTADPCVANPLSSTNCKGYAVAYAKNMLLGSTVASASAPATAPPPAPAESAPAIADPSPAIAQAAPAQSSPPPPPPPDASQNPSVAQDNPAQPSPTQQGPASTTPQPAGGPPQATQTASSSNPSGPSGGSAGPSKLAMSVLKTAQANDKATQQMAVQNAAKTLEGSMQSSQASSNLAISMNQDMSANSAVAAATFASQTTQASTQTATQSSQGTQQTTQVSTQTQQVSKAGPQTQQQQQDTQQAEIQYTTVAQYQAPQQQEVQQAQTQANTSTVKLLSPQQEDSQPSQTAIVTQYQPQQQQEQQTQVQSSTSVVKLLSPKQEESQPAQTQTASIVQYQSPQQEVQQAQTQSNTSVVKLLPPPQQEQVQSSMQTAVAVQTQQVYTPTQQLPDTQSTQIAMLKPPAPQEIETQQTSSGTGITVSRNLFAYNPSISTSSNTSTSTTQPAPMYQPKLDTRQFEVETPQYQISSFSGVGKAGNPLSEIIMQQRFELMQSPITQSGSSVNRNVLPNELAGGIDIASIASVPTGFNAYSFVLKDASFYEPKEVYKNQQTVDNVRLLRGLTGGSDAKHQEMVNQQYNIGERK